MFSPPPLSAANAVRSLLRKRSSSVPLPRRPLHSNSRLSQPRSSSTAGPGHPPDPVEQSASQSSPRAPRPPEAPVHRTLAPLPAMRPTAPLPVPFGEFFSVSFARRFPHIAALVRPDHTALAANVYLFRFDKHISTDFITSTIDSVSRSIADASGKSVPEARRLFASGTRDAAREYFAGGWNDVSRFITANTPTLLNLQLESAKQAQLLDSVSADPEPSEVDPILLQSLLDQPRPILLFVYANYCSVCTAVRPLFDQAARELDGSVIFTVINGPSWAEFKDKYTISSYPTILRFQGGSEPIAFPRTHNYKVERFVAFAKGVLPSSPPPPPESPDPYDEMLSPRTRASNWQSLLRKQGIDQLEMLAEERDEVLHSQIDNAIQCTETSCERITPRSHDPEKGEVPPLCVLLGGGMGAGKTTVVGLVAATKFWEEHGDNIVVVEADAFKLTDPLFQVLQSVTPLASRIVHRDSIIAAEELFVQAVNSRRDVVFDGTLSWCEYAQQTVAMLRDTMYTYKRGPGYVENGDGSVTEQYWIRKEKRQRAVDPYRVELVGVTAEAEVAVMRGIVRRITTGRGVAVPDQLKSHALFSQHFEEYVDMADSIYLFDTTLQRGPAERPGYGDQLVAIKPGVLFGVPKVEGIEVARAAPINGFKVICADAYERFLRKTLLNVKANSVQELYNGKAVGG